MKDVLSGANKRNVSLRVQIIAQNPLDSHLELEHKSRIMKILITLGTFCTLVFGAACEESEFYDFLNPLVLIFACLDPEIIID